MPGPVKIHPVVRKIARACREIAERFFTRLRTGVGSIRKWLEVRDRIAILALTVSLVTLGLSQIPVVNLSYHLNHLDVENLSIITPAGVSSDPTFELLVTLINNGNEPAAVNAIELFVSNQVLHGPPTDIDCDRNGNWNVTYLYLYEHSAPENGNERGTDIEANFGRRKVRPLALPPYNTVQDLHRFSVVDQMTPKPAVNGLVCLDVQVTTVGGVVSHRPQLLGQIHVALGKLLADPREKELGLPPTWVRINYPILQSKPTAEAYEQQRNLPGPQSKRMWLYYNFWYWL